MKTHLQLVVLLDQLVHAGDLALVVFAFAVHLLPVFLQTVDLLLSQLVLLVGFLGEELCFGLDELSDALADQIFGLELVVEDLDALTKSLFVLIEDSSLATDLALGFSRTILHVEFLLGLCLVNLLLQGEYLLVIFVRFLCEIILFAFVLLVQILDLRVQVLFLKSQTVKFALRVQPCTNIAAELRKRKFSEFCVELLHVVD